MKVKVTTRDGYTGVSVLHRVKRTKYRVAARMTKVVQPTRPDVVELRTFLVDQGFSAKDPEMLLLPL